MKLNNIKKNLKFVKQKQIPHNNFSRVVGLLIGKRSKYYIFNMINYERKFVTVLRYIQTLSIYRTKMLLLSEFNEDLPIVNRVMLQYKKEWSPGLFLRTLLPSSKEKLKGLPHALITISNVSDNKMAVKEASRINILNFTFTYLDQDLFYYSDNPIPFKHSIKKHSKILHTLILSKIIFSKLYKTNLFFNEIRKQKDKIFKQARFIGFKNFKRRIVINTPQTFNELRRLDYEKKRLARQKILEKQGRWFVRGRRSHNNNAHFQKKWPKKSGFKKIEHYNYEKTFYPKQKNKKQYI